MNPSPLLSYIHFFLTPGFEYNMVIAVEVTNPIPPISLIMWKYLRKYLKSVFYAMNNLNIIKERVLLHSHITIVSDGLIAVINS